MLYAVDIMTSRLILYFKRIFEMKKTLLFGLVFAVLLIVPVTAWAQRPVGDTLVTFDTDYLFPRTLTGFLLRTQAGGLQVDLFLFLHIMISGIIAIQPPRATGTISAGCNGIQTILSRLSG